MLISAGSDRRRCREPPDRGVRYAVGPRNVRQRLAGVAASDSLALLMRRQPSEPSPLIPPSEADT
jgi:hypothetical protein